MRRAGQLSLLAALALGAFAPGAAHAVSAPLVHQLVVFRSGAAKASNVTAAQVSVRAGSKRCAVGAGTPLAALVRSRVARLGIHDYGSCSRSPRDAGGLYVRSIGSDAGRGQNGWVYKVGQRLAPAGAADPAGPFGNGRMKNGAQVTWFYCRYDGRVHGCQRTLGLTVAPATGGVRVSVKAYDDQGRATAAAGVTVHAGAATAVTDASGNASVSLPAGSYEVFADGAAVVRSPPVRATVG
jgi:hypothetical protein